MYKNCKHQIRTESLWQGLFPSPGETSVENTSSAFAENTVIYFCFQVAKVTFQRCIATLFLSKPSPTHTLKSGILKNIGFKKIVS